jgi:hypothetical protein
MANATVGAKAGTLDLEIEQGATFSTTITWQAGETPAPVNLTGYTARAKLRKDDEGGEVIVSLTTASGITLGGTAGTITLRITDEQTALITAEGGKWDLELEDATGDVRRLLRGNWKLVREVTY